MHSGALALPHNAGHQPGAPQHVPALTPRSQATRPSLNFRFAGIPLHMRRLKCRSFAESAYRSGRSPGFFAIDGHFSWRDRQIFRLSEVPTVEQPSIAFVYECWSHYLP
jgi:hypothetical protein